MYRVKEDFNWPLSLAKDFIVHIPEFEDQSIQLHCFLINNDCTYEGRVRPHKNELTMDVQFCVGLSPNSSDEESKDDEDQFPELFPDPPKISFKAGTVIIVSNLAFEEVKPRLKDFCSSMKVIANGLKGPFSGSLKLEDLSTHNSNHQWKRNLKWITLVLPNDPSNDAYSCVSTL